MARPPEPMFLERENYRWRRLGDAAKLLPILGLVLFLLPILWSGNATTARGVEYLFSVWVVLIVVAAFLSRRLPGAASNVEPKSEDRSEED